MPVFQNTCVFMTGNLHHSRNQLTSESPVKTLLVKAQRNAPTRRRCTKQVLVFVPSNKSWDAACGQKGAAFPGAITGDAT